MKLYCATSNAGKLREFTLAAQRLGRGEWEFIPFTEVPPCEETGRTFEENALQKALYYSRHADGLLFAEDSGLTVEALGGAPGVFSARFSPDGTDNANNELLVQKLKGIENRTARYVCAIALANEGHPVQIFRGEVQGCIIDEPRGSNGFGYDPHFFYPPYGCTFAEAVPDMKIQVSHRGRAAKQMLQYLLSR
jgi:XTP/dITP diphosphohydrolase